MIELTGLRNPCVLMDRFQPGLKAATLDRDADGNLIRKAGVMSVVISAAMCGGRCDGRRGGAEPASGRSMPGRSAVPAATSRYDA